MHKDSHTAYCIAYTYIEYTPYTDLRPGSIYFYIVERVSYHYLWINGPAARTRRIIIRMYCVAIIYLVCLYIFIVVVFIIISKVSAGAAYNILLLIIYIYVLLYLYIYNFSSTTPPSPRICIKNNIHRIYIYTKLYAYT